MVHKPHASIDDVPQELPSCDAWQHKIELRSKALLAALLLFLLPPRGQPSNAQDDPFDLLDDLQTESREKGLFRQIAGNAEFRLNGRIASYFRNPEPRHDLDRATLVGDGRFEFTTRANRGRHRFGISTWLEYGTQEDTYSQKDYGWGIDQAVYPIERHRRYFELDELFWISSSGSMDVTVGKKSFTIGIAPLYSPADRVKTVDFNDPLDSKSYGLWQLRLDYYRGTSTCTFAVLPFFAVVKIPGPESRWLPNTEGLLPADFQFFNTLFDPVFGIDTDIPDGADEIQWVSRLKTTVRGWDLFAAGIVGPAPFPVLRSGNPNAAQTPVREYVRATAAAAGFSTTIERFELHGEGLFQWSLRGRDDDYFSGVAGATYTLDQLSGAERIRLTLDYALELVADRQDAPGYLQSSKIVRLGQDDLILQALVQFRDELVAELLADIDLDDGGWLAAPEIRYRRWTGTWLKIRLDLLFGKQNSFYGRWTRNRRLAAAIEYSF